MVTFGRAEECSIAVNKDNFPDNLVLNVSKVHFTIIRDVYNDLIYIKDESKNGIFINGTIVGKGNRNILENDDTLSLGFKGSQNCEYRTNIMIMRF